VLEVAGGCNNDSAWMVSFVKEIDEVFPTKFRDSSKMTGNRPA
jgi:hypothetical protein